MAFASLLIRRSSLAAVAGVVLALGCEDAPLTYPESPRQEEGQEPAFASAATSLRIANVSSTTKGKYAVDNSLQAGDLRYTDRGRKFIAPLPKEILGHPFIRTANDDRTAARGSSAMLSFDVDQPVTVYVAMDNREVQPDWVKGWSKTDLMVHDDDKPTKKFVLLKKDYAAGRVTLGSNYWSEPGDMFTVFIVPGQASQKQEQAPKAPGTVHGVASSPTRVNLTWEAVGDAGKGVRYQVSRESKQLATVADLAFADTTVSPGKKYRYDVRTVSASGMISKDAASVTVQTPNASAPKLVPATIAPRAAFPGAEGHGALALTQCDRRNVQKLFVTNLNDRGPGSLRAAIEAAKGNVLSVVIFTVGGYITLNSRIEIESNCLYIAGQTAPGDGITIRAPDRQAFLFKRQPRDVVIRYLRIRNGTNQPGVNTLSQGIIIGAGTNIVIDHVSMSWASDQILSIYRYPEKQGWGDIRDITVQRALIAEPLSGQPTCYGIKGETSLKGDRNGIPQWYEIEDVTFHHNAAISCSHRAPMISAKAAEVINNVVYNWGQGAMSTNGRQAYVDYIGNYFEPGPMTRPDLSYGYEFSHEFAGNRPGGAGGEPDPYVIIGNVSDVDRRGGPGFYLDGNVGPHNPSGALDNWSMTSKYKNDGSTYPEKHYSKVVYGKHGLMPVSVAGVSLRRNSRLPQPAVPVRVESAKQAWQSLIVNGDVGNNAALTCDGDWRPNADAVDKRLFREALSGSGRRSPKQLASEREVGGFPQLASGKRCADADSDGMPDAFELRYKLDPRNPADADSDPNGNGYTNLEEYLNGTRPS